MSDNEIVDESEAAIEALFSDFKSTSFPDGWETAILEAATLAPVIRIAPKETSAPTLPAPTRVHAPATFWIRHRLTAARIAAATVLVAGAGVLLSFLPDNGEVEIAAETTSTTSEIGVPTTAPFTSSSAPDPTTSTIAPVEEPPIANPVPDPPSIVTTTVPPPPPDPSVDPTPVPNPPSTTVPTTPSTQASVATVNPTVVDPTTTVPPTTAVPSTTVPSTTVPSTTVPSTTVPSTTVPSTTVPTTTPPVVAADVEIRGLSVGKITATSAVVSFRTNDCSGARYQLSGGINTWADGYPNDKQCWNDHYAILGQSPFSRSELVPDTKYIARITTYAADGTTANARITFKTLPLEFELPPVLDPEADPAP